jgi:hypothetical protein
MLFGNHLPKALHEQLNLLEKNAEFKINSVQYEERVLGGAGENFNRFV